VLKGKGLAEKIYKFCQKRKELAKKKYKCCQKLNVGSKFCQKKKIAEKRHKFSQNLEA